MVVEVHERRGDNLPQMDTLFFLAEEGRREFTGKVGFELG